MISYKKFIKGLRFIVSGSSAAFTALLLFYIFSNLLGMWYLSASILSFLLAVVVGFIMQKYYTFKNHSKTGAKKQAIIFFVISLINLGINVLLMSFFVGLLSFNQMLAKVVTLGILACWNFFVYQKFVFRDTMAKQ